MRDRLLIALGVFVALALVVTPATAQFAESFEPLTAGAAGVLLGGQGGWYVPPVASSADGGVYTYAGNTLGLGANPTGGAQFAGATNPGTPFNTRIQHVFGTPPFSGVWECSFDICVNYLGATYPAVNNISSISLQPSTTAKHFIALAAWEPPIPTTGAPTGWRMDWVFFDGATGLTQVQASVGNAALGIPASLPSCFKNLQLRSWYRVRLWLDWGTNSIQAISIANLSNGWIGYINAPGWYMRGGLGNVGAATDPTDLRLFVGGTTAGNTAGFDNLMIAPSVAPTLGTEYQVDQPGVATGDINGVFGTALCPAVVTTSLTAGGIVNLTLGGGLYDVALNLGPALPASNPLAIILPDGQVFNLDFASTVWLCPGGPAPCFAGTTVFSFPALPPGTPPITGQVVAFGVGALGVSFSQPFTLISEL